MRATLSHHYTRNNRTASAINGLLQSLDRNFDDTAADQVAAVSFAYSLKVNQVGLGFKGQAKNLDIIKLLRDGGNTSAVQKILDFEETSRSIELVYVLNKDMQVVCGSHKNLLAGQTVDPDGVVSLLKNNLTLGGGQIKKTSIISYELLMHQGAPTFRERTSDLEAAMVNTHPIDTKSSSLI
eukprot:12739-Heterococcus_DN1.PRE.2